MSCYWKHNCCSSSVCLTPVFLSHIQEQFSQVLDAMFELLVQPREHVIDQGDDGDNFYVIERYSHQHSLVLMRGLLLLNALNKVTCLKKFAQRFGFIRIFVIMPGVRVCDGQRDAMCNFPLILLR